jgi:hypothetical protein
MTKLKKLEEIQNFCQLESKIYTPEKSKAMLALNDLDKLKNTNFEWPE